MKKIWYCVDHDIPRYRGEFARRHSAKQLLSLRMRQLLILEKYQEYTVIKKPTEHHKSKTPITNRWKNSAGTALSFFYQGFCDCKFLQYASN